LKIKPRLKDVSMYVFDIRDIFSPVSIKGSWEPLVLIIWQFVIHDSPIFLH
jgi:hypothetical protein